MSYFLLFDFDYTLADASAGIIECFNYALPQMGFQKASKEAICKTIGLTLDNAFMELTGQFHDEVTIKQFKVTFKERADEIMADSTVLYDSVKETLETLKHNGNRLGIISTKFRYRIESTLKREGIFELFDIIIGGEDVKSHKPNPEGVLKAVAEVKIPLSQCIFIGDSITDAETAENAGIRFIATLTGTTTRKDFERHRVEKYIQEIKELSGYLIQGI